MEEIYGNFDLYLAAITRKVHKFITFFPVIRINEQIFIFLSLLLIAIFIIIGIAIFLDTRWSKILAVILGGLEILNGGLHILSSLYFRKYIPGTICAIGLVIFAILVIWIKPTLQTGKTEVEG
jgi:hypothetical protein